MEIKFETVICLRMGKTFAYKVPPGKLRVISSEEFTNQEINSYKYKKSYSTGLFQNTNL